MLPEDSLLRQEETCQRTKQQINNTVLQVGIVCEYNTVVPKIRNVKL
jgi:hypothetical protein